MINRTARQDTIAIMKGEFRSTCDVITEVIMRPPGSLDEVWTRPWDRTKDDVFYLMWFIQLFGSRVAYKLAERINGSVDRYWSNLADLGYSEFGISSHVSEPCKNALKCELLIAQFPSLDSIVNTPDSNISAEKAVAKINEMVFKDDRWLVR